MPSVVLDASAVLALIREESGGDKVLPYIVRAAISAVNLHEVIKELLLSALDVAVIRDMLDELRLEVRAHNVDAAYAAAALHEQTKKYGRGLGDRCCLALAMTMGVPALTADSEWRNVKVKGVKVENLR